MTWAEHGLSFSSLIYQYTDIAGSPDEASAWDTEDLEYLIALVQAELQRRALSASVPTEKT